MARSAGFYVGMGCLGFVILGFVGCGVAGLVGFNVVNKTFNQPVSEAIILQELNGIPKYPEATFNETATKLTHGLFKVISWASKDKQILGGVFDVKDSPDKVLVWYDEKMKEAGYKPVPVVKTEKNSERESVTHQYEKEKSYVQVMIRKSVTAGKSKAQELVLLRFEGFTDKEIAQIGKDTDSNEATK
jgi:hypothetical protein